MNWTPPRGADDGEGDIRKHYSLSQVIPASTAKGDRELKRLLEGMQQFKNDPPPGILLTEVLHPADPRGSSDVFNEA